MSTRTRLTFVPSFSFVASLLMGGCSAGSSLTSSAPNGGSSGGEEGGVFDGAGARDGGEDSDGAAAADPHCNSITQQGRAVAVTGSTGPVPSAEGGALRDGFYILTGSTLHGPQYNNGPIPGASAVPTTVEIRGSSYSEVISGPIEKRRSWTMTISPTTNQVKFALTCAYPSYDAGNDGLAEGGPYTATASRFTFAFNAAGAGVAELVYTKL